MHVNAATPQDSVTTYCAPLTFTFEGTITLTAENREDLQVDLSTLSMSGPMTSQGDETLQCPR